MNPQANDPAPPAPPPLAAPAAPAASAEIDSAKTFGDAIVASVAQALQRRARRLVFVDPDFDDWPLDNIEMHSSLTGFARLPGRELVLLASSFDAMQRRCPRFVVWRRVWGHVVAAWRPADDEVRLPSVLLADRTIAVELLDRVDWRGQVLTDDRRLHRLADEVDVFLQRCEPAFGASTLGL